MCLVVTVGNWKPDCQIAFHMKKVFNIEIKANTSQLKGNASLSVVLKILLSPNAKATSAFTTVLH